MQARCEQRQQELNVQAAFEANVAEPSTHKNVGEDDVASHSGQSLPQRMAARNEQQQQSSISPAKGKIVGGTSVSGDPEIGLTKAELKRSPALAYIRCLPFGAVPGWPQSWPLCSPSQ